MDIGYICKTFKFMVNKTWLPTSAKEIKKLGLFTKILILTGHGSIDSAMEATKMGAYDYLPKPCEISELVEKIEWAWEKRVNV